LFEAAYINGGGPRVTTVNLHSIFAALSVGSRAFGKR
jgi:hypothetical protein